MAPEMSKIRSILIQAILLAALTCYPVWASPLPILEDSYIFSDRADIYASPNSSASLIDTLPIGTKVAILKPNNLDTELPGGWYLIRYHKSAVKTGFIQAKEVSHFAYQNPTTPGASNVLFLIQNEGFQNNTTLSEDPQSNQRPRPILKVVRANKLLSIEPLESCGKISGIEASLELQTLGSGQVAVLHVQHKDLCEGFGLEYHHYFLLSEMSFVRLFSFTDSSEGGVSIRHSVIFPQPGEPENNAILVEELLIVSASAGFPEGPRSKKTIQKYIWDSAAGKIEGP